MKPMRKIDAKCRGIGRRRHRVVRQRVAKCTASSTVMKPLATIVHDVPGSSHPGNATSASNGPNGERGDRRHKMRSVLAAGLESEKPLPGERHRLGNVIRSHGVAADIAKVDVGVRLDARQKGEKTKMQRIHQDSLQGPSPSVRGRSGLEKPDRRAPCYRRRRSAGCADRHLIMTRFRLDLGLSAAF